MVRGLDASVASKGVLLAQQPVPGASGKAAGRPAAFTQAAPKDLFPPRCSVLGKSSPGWSFNSLSDFCCLHSAAFPHL